jgi:hypothetical protein
MPVRCHGSQLFSSSHNIKRLGRAIYPTANHARCQIRPRCSTFRKRRGRAEEGGRTLPPLLPKKRRIKSTTVDAAGEEDDGEHVSHRPPHPRLLRCRIALLPRSPLPPILQHPDHPSKLPLPPYPSLVPATSTPTLSFFPHLRWRRHRVVRRVRESPKVTVPTPVKELVQ